jgi:hypothetical protein
MGHHPFMILVLTPISIWRTLSGGQFKWGACLLKSNGGVQRSASSGWKSELSYKGISRLDCKADKPRRYESRA